MGSCLSSQDKNRELDNFISQRMAQEDKDKGQISKLLFLGPGGSGKSTIFKQLQWLHSDGFSEEDACTLKGHIYSQVTSQMVAAIHYLIPKEAQSEPTMQEMINTVRDHQDHTAFTEKLAAAISYIWKNSPTLYDAFHTPAASQSKKVLDESTEYFWNELDRIKSKEYIPNELDIIQVRYRTTGVIQKDFHINKMPFQIYDVGGQRAERRKWISCFSEVKAIVFVISLACYNEMMYEDGTRNAMADSLEIFEQTVNTKCFQNTHIILFLNKKDLFERKIPKVPITACPSFGDFGEVEEKKEEVIEVDPCNYEQTTKYISYKFEKLVHDPTKMVHVHITCAMEKANIENVFMDVVRITVQNGLARNGLLGAPPR